MAERAFFDTIILGGGPAGSAAGRLLSAWGHSDLLLDKPGPSSRGLAESLPPSTQKLLGQIGSSRPSSARDSCERPATRSGGALAAGASRRSKRRAGYQVHRPAFDRVLLDCARDAGASRAAGCTRPRHPVPRRSAQPSSSTTTRDAAVPRRAASSSTAPAARAWSAGVSVRRSRAIEPAPSSAFGDCRRLGSARRHAHARRNLRRRMDVVGPDVEDDEACRGDGGPRLAACRRGPARWRARTASRWRRPPIS